MGKERKRRTGLVIVAQNDIIDPISMKLGTLAKGTGLAGLNRINVDFPFILIRQRIVSEPQSSLPPCSYNSAEDVSWTSYWPFVFFVLYSICPAGHLVIISTLIGLGRKLDSVPFPTFLIVLSPLVFASSLVIGDPRREQDHLFLYIV